MFSFCPRSKRALQAMLRAEIVAERNKVAIIIVEPLLDEKRKSGS